METPIQFLVLIMVIVPLPCVWILVRATTAFPERPGPFGDTMGRQAKSPTGCLTGLVGGIRILSLMSLSVISPLNPPGFTNANGYTTLVITLLLLSSNPLVFSVTWSDELGLSLSEKNWVLIELLLCEDELE